MVLCMHSRRGFSLLVAAGALGLAVPVLAADRELITWKKQVLTPEFWAEGAGIGDFNKDGSKDVVSGPYWYEGPQFTRRHEIYPAGKTFVVKGPDGQVIEEGRLTTRDGNGGRAHFRFQKTGASYPEGSTVEFRMNDGTVKTYTIKDTSMRND